VTAILAAAARAVLAAVLVLAAVTSVFWVAYGPQNFWTVLWLLAMFVTITGGGVALAALQPRNGGNDG
jgi:hypothetical protein